MRRGMCFTLLFVIQVYKTADDVPEDELQLLGWIAMGIPAQDFMNLSLTEIETIAAFGQWRNFSKEQVCHQEGENGHEHFCSLA